MDNERRRQLVEFVQSHGYVDMASPRILVTREQVFTGNDDEASIGCNLMEHPGVPAFAEAFRKIEQMSGVAGVYFTITELLDEDDQWPFTDTAFIVTTLSAEAFEMILAPLEPDEIEPHREEFANPPEIPPKHRLVYVWWD